MPPQAKLLSTRAAIQELSRIAEDSRSMLYDSEGETASLGLCALEASRVLGAFNIARKTLKPPTIEKVLSRLDQEVVIDSQLVLRRAMAHETSPSQATRNTAAKILSKKTYINDNLWEASKKPLLPRKG